jgi:hypothetical protein
MRTIWTASQVSLAVTVTFVALVACCGSDATRLSSADRSASEPTATNSFAGRKAAKQATASLATPPVEPICRFAGVREPPDQFQAAPGWSPDGAWFAFARTDADGRWNLYVVGSDDAERRWLTED